MRPASGFVWSMNWLSWLEPKNSLIAATTGRMLIRVCGVIASTSWVVMRSRTTRSIRLRPTRTWFWMSSPTERTRRLPKWSMSSGKYTFGWSFECSFTRYDTAARMSARDSVYSTGPASGSAFGIGMPSRSKVGLTLSYSLTSFFVTLCRPTLAMS